MISKMVKLQLEKTKDNVDYIKVAGTLLDLLKIRNHQIYSNICSFSRCVYTYKNYKYNYTFVNRIFLLLYQLVFIIHAVQSDCVYLILTD